MGEWWFVVFWLLLIPLIIVELIIFLKSRRFFWLVYALSIFTYIVAVSYTIDVFDLGKNAVILTLLASAVLMFIIGRQLGKSVKKQKVVPRLERNIAIVLASIMALLFIISIIFGKGSETVSPVASLSEAEIVRTYNEQKGIEYRGDQGITVLKRTITNNFILPVPVEQRQYQGCIVTSRGTFNIDPSYNYMQEYEEVGPGETKTFDAKIQPYYRPDTLATDATELRIYSHDRGDYSYAPCESITKDPDFVIPIE